MVVCLQSSIKKVHKCIEKKIVLNTCMMVIRLTQMLYGCMYIYINHIGQSIDSPYSIAHPYFLSCFVLEINLKHNTIDDNIVQR